MLLLGQNHEQGMYHSHYRESKLKPEMSVKPSALWQKRHGYNRTSAALRGDQLLNYERTLGKFRSKDSEMDVPASDISES